MDSDAFTKDCILQYQVTLDSAVSVGNLVYYDVSGACYKKAVAEYISDSLTGQITPTNKCYVQGLVISKESSGNSGVILRQGYFKDSLIQDTLLGTTPGAGIYYLDADTPGKATQAPNQNIKIPCISYYGSYAFSFMPAHYVRVGKGQNTLKGVSSQTLSVTNAGQGIIQIEQPERAYYTRRYNPIAVAQLTNNRITYTDIVSKLYSGAGIQITDLNYGRWRVSAKTAVNSKLVANDFTLNGTQRVADSLLTYTVFPKGAITSMTMSMPVNFIQKASVFTGTVGVWMTTRGPGTATYTVSVYWLPFGTSMTSTTIPSSPLYTVDIVTGNSSNNKLALAQQTPPQAIQFTGQGILVAKIETKTAPSNDCYVHQAGFQFTEAAEQQEQVSSDASPAIPMTAEEIENMIANYLKWQTVEVTNV